MKLPLYLISLISLDIPLTSPVNVGYIAFSHTTIRKPGTEFMSTAQTTHHCLLSYPIWSCSFTFITFFASYKPNNSKKEDCFSVYHICFFMHVALRHIQDYMGDIISHCYFCNILFLCSCIMIYLYNFCSAFLFTRMWMNVVSDERETTLMTYMYWWSQYSRFTGIEPVRCSVVHTHFMDEIDIIFCCISNYRYLI